MSGLIDSGKIRQNRKNLSSICESYRNDSPYEMKFLNKDYLQELVILQDLIAESLPKPEIFRLHEEKDFTDIFQSEHSVIGVTTCDGLVAYSIIRIPGLAVDNLGRDIKLAKEEHMKVAHLQATAVHPLFRGNGLQQKLAKAHLGELEEMGYKHVCCTVSPRNPISLHNIMSCGFVIKALIPKFEGWWRYIMYKGILRPSGAGAGANTGTGSVTGSATGSATSSVTGSVASSATSSVSCAVINTNSNVRIGPGSLEEEMKIKCSDIDGQIDLLKRGFEGFRMAPLSSNPEVFYRKF